MKKIFKYAICGVGILFLFGFLFQFISTKIDESNFPPPGKMVDIGGYKLHIHCTGEQQKHLPTVILDAGSGNTSIDWALVQPQVAQFARVCSFDRAGMGWSEAGPLPRTSSRMVSELHTLLKNGQVDGPYLMVGHSFGGLIVRLFANTYPDDVFGVVLVDSAHEDSFNKLNIADTLFFKVLRHPNLVTFLAGSGLLRALISTPPFPMERFSLETKKMWIAKGVTTKFARAWSQEIMVGERSYSELAESPNMLRQKPLIVISAGKSEYQPNMRENEKEHYEQRFAIWTEMQEDLVRKSSTGKLIVATKSGHLILHEQPEIIVDAVREILEPQANQQALPDPQ